MIENQPTIYTAPTVYNQAGGGGGGGSDYELVFYTNFSNLNNGVDTPIIGENASTDLTQVTSISTPVLATSGGQTTSSPGGYKKIVNLSSYVSGKKRAILHYLINCNPNNSYCTISNSISGSYGILFQTTSTNIKISTSDTSSIKVPNTSSNPVQLTRFVYNYTSDKWKSVDWIIDYEQKKLQLYIYGILVYEINYNATSLEIGVGLLDGCSITVTDIKLYTK